ncbi:hypothetical protein [Xylophilus rhododendri]|nr:hypothetical protein [Xylophilus rhododendri]
MLRLNPEQAAALQAIKRERDIAGLSAVLSAAFPEVPSRLAERYGELIAMGVQRGTAHGLDHVLCLARYLACWFMLGAAFESKPEFAWAQELLAAPGRPQGGKVFQLCRRTREELARLSAQAGAGGGGTSPAAFDQAIAQLDAQLMPRGFLGCLLPAGPIALGEACDIDAIDLRLLEPPPARQPHHYRFEQEQWRRLPTGITRPAITLAAGAAAAAREAPPALPPRLFLLSQPSERDFSRLRLRTRASHCCDPQLHPLVTLNGAQGLASWRGAHAADVVLNLYAETPPSVGDGPQPAIAVESLPQLSTLELGSCGLRETGVPLGDQKTLLSVYPSEQHWMIWRREPGPPMAWPETATPPPSPPALYRIERDGLALDASRWQAGLADLDRQLAEGLARLATAWERESGVLRGRMEAQPQVLAGSAGITWGWAESAANGAVLAQPPVFRVAGVLDLVACQLDLRLQGELNLFGSQSRLSLHCAGRAPLKVAFERLPGTDLPAAIAPAQTALRLPFVLELESLAQGDTAALADATGPVAGALVGSCGLRPAPAGGLQWFCQLAIEPVSVALRVHDPLLGSQTSLRPLLPAMSLLDWSLG